MPNLALTAVIVVSMIVLVGCRPGIAYLSRDKARVGLEGENLAPCPTTLNCVSSQSTNEPQRVDALGINQDPQQTMNRLIEIIKQLPQAHIVKTESHYLHATFRSKYMGFIDDVELLHSAPQKHIDIKSGSRLGLVDFGANRRRVDFLRNRLEQITATQERN